MSAGLIGGRSPAGLPLGDDLLALVLGHLRPSDLAAAEGVCRRWRQVASQHRLWQPHAAAVAGAPPPQQPWLREQQGADAMGLPWKQLYLEAKWRHAFASPADQIRTVRVEREAHGGAAVTALSAGVAGSLLLSAGADGSLCLWDLSPCRTPSSNGGSAPLRPRLLCRAQHSAPLVSAQLLAPDTALSTTAAAAFVWRIQHSGEQDLGTAAVAAAGEAAAADRSSGGAQQPTFRLVRPFNVEGGITCAVAWDQYLAVGCADGAVRIYDTYAGSCAKLLRLHQGRVSALQHVRRGELDLLVSGGADGRLFISDSGSTLTLAEARVARGGVSCLLLEPSSGRLLAGSTAPGASHCWMAGQWLSGLPSPAQRLRLPSNARLPQLAHAGVAALTAAALPLFGGSSLFLGGCGTGLMHICSLETGATLQSFRPPDPSRGASPAGGQPQQAQQAQQALQAQQHSRHSGSGDSSGAAAGGSAPSAQHRQPGSRPGLVSPTGTRHQSCLCLCADTMPVAAGFADGRLVFWRWRRQDSAQAAGPGTAGGAAAVGQAATAGAGIPAAAVAGSIDR